MATISNNDLAQNLDQLVAAFVQAAQQMVLAAVAEGLATKPDALAKTASSTQGSKSNERSKSSKRPKAKSSKPSKRRAPSEVAELSERFYTVLCRHPGATMAVLAPKVGASPRELHRPVALLKRAGRVRSAGQRQWTTYFPMAGVAEAA